MDKLTRRALLKELATLAKEMVETQATLDSYVGNWGEVEEYGATAENLIAYIEDLQDQINDINAQLA